MPPLLCWRRTEHALRYRTTYGTPLREASKFISLEKDLMTRIHDLLLLNGIRTIARKRKLIQYRPSFLRSPPFKRFKEDCTRSVTRSEEAKIILFNVFMVSDLGA